MLDILINEARELALPCYDLIPAAQGDEVLAHWSGKRSDLPEDFPSFVGAYKFRRHVLSVDESLFESLRLKGRYPFALTIDTRRDEDESEVAATIPTSSGSLTSVTFEGTIPLKAVPAISLPPLEAVLLYGSPKIDSLLKEFGLRRWEYSGLTDNIAEEYRIYFYEGCPLMADQPAFARVGGWHLPWMDDYYLPREMRLMIWTFQDSEPWYEVFLTPMLNQVVQERIT